MQNKRVYIEYKVDGVLENAYQVKIASNDASFGIKTGTTVVVQSGTSVTNSSVGVYEYTFEAENDKIYVVSWEIYSSASSEPAYVSQTIGPFSEIIVSSNPVQAVADYRGSFLQGKLTTLMLKTTSFEGRAMDPGSISISIRDEEDAEVVAGIPEKIANGFFIYDWAISSEQEPGPYTAVWSYSAEGQTFNVYQGIIVIADGTGPEAYSPYSERIASMRASLDYHLGQAQAIPVYDVEGVVAEDQQTVRFTFPRWNQNHRTRIYRNGKLVTSGITINYFRGEVMFDEPMHDKYDRVTADYNFRWFPDEELDRFLSNGIHIVNAAPPAMSRNLLNIEDRYIPAVLYGATIDALRHLILDLQFQEPQEVFGGPEMANKAAAMFETLKKNYEGTFKMLLDFKKVGPYKGLTKVISVPEFTLPGGRSRWFRYMMGGFNLT